MSQKSYNDTPSVFIIPTPIGNMEDITIRAINTLNLVDVIFSEDTRVTLQLLNHLNIKKKLIASHQYNEEKQKKLLLDYLNKGSNVGIVTDRGTPIISDPGYILVQEAINNNYNVISLPGPTALIPALTSSGIKPEPFTFYGFLNSKTTKRRKELELLKRHSEALIFYEAPHRLEETLTDILEVLGNRQISVSREISKKYEEVYRGSIEEVIEQTKNAKGEFVIVVEGNVAQDFTDLPVIEHVNLYVKEGKSVKDAIKVVAKERNEDKREIYNIYHNLGGKS